MGCSYIYKKIGNLHDFLKNVNILRLLFINMVFNCKIFHLLLETLTWHLDGARSWEKIIYILIDKPFDDHYWVDKLFDDYWEWMKFKLYWTL